MKNNVEFEFVTCGKNHCLAISTQGTLYSFGWNKSGQCGYPNNNNNNSNNNNNNDDNNNNNETTPQLRVVESLKDKRSIHCAAGDQHSLVVVLTSNSNEGNSILLW